MDIQRQNIVIQYETNLAQLQRDLTATTRQSQQFEDVTGQTVEQSSRLERQTNRTGRSFGGFRTLLRGVGAAFAAIGIAQVTRQLLDLSTTIEASTNKNSIVFGETLDLVTQAARENALQLGLTTGQYVSASAAIADLLIPMGFQREEAAQISTQLVDLSGALSEWSGGQVSATQVTDILSKSLLGEREQLKTLGISISEADVQNRLAEQGLKGLTGASLQQAKAYATLQLVTERSRDAQSSFAENTDSLARSQARLQANIGNIQAAIGTALIPVFQRLLAAVEPTFTFLGENAPAAIRFVFNAIAPLVQSIGRLIDNVTGGVGALGAIEGSFRALGGVIQFVSNTINAIANGISDLIENVPFVSRAVESARNAFQGWQQILQNLPSVFAGVLEAARQVGTNIASFFTNTALRAQILLAEIEGIFNAAAQARADALRAQLAVELEGGRTVAQAFQDGFDSVERTIDTTETREQAGSSFRSIGEFAGKEFGEGLSSEQKKALDKAAEEQRKALEQAAREQAEAFENILDLRNAAIQNSAERQSTELRTATRRSIEALVGTPEQVAEQTRLLIEARDRELANIDQAAITQTIDTNRESRASDDQFLADQRAEEEAELIAAEQRQTDLKLLEVERRRLLVKQNLQAGVIDEDEAARQQTLLTIEGLKEQLTQLEISAADRIRLRQELIDAEIALEKEGTEATKQEAEERRKAITEAGMAVIGVAKQIADANVAELDRQVAAQQEAVNQARQTIDQGNAEQVQLEEDRLNRLNQAREQAAQRQRVIAAIEIATNSAIAVSQGIVATTAAFKEGNLVKGIATAVALAATVTGSVLSIRGALAGVGSFAKGTEGVRSSDGIPMTDGSILLKVHKGERITKAKESKQLKGISDAKLVDLVKADKSQTLSEQARSISDLTTAQASSLQGVQPSQVASTQQMRIELNGLMKEMQGVNSKIETTNRKLGNIKTQVILDKEGVRLISKRYDAERRRKSGI